MVVADFNLLGFWQLSFPWLPCHTGPTPTPGWPSESLGSSRFFPSGSYLCNKNWKFGRKRFTQQSGAKFGNVLVPEYKSGK